MRPIRKGNFAKERRVSAGRVSHWLRDGRIVELESGKIDADDAHARLDAHLDQSKGMRRGGNITSNSIGSPAGAEQSNTPQREGDAAGNGDTAPDLMQQGAARGNETDAGPSVDVAGAGNGDGAPSGEKGATVGRDDTGYWESKARREKAEAQLAEMKAMQAAGVLTSAIGVSREARETGRALRNALLAFPDRLAPVLDPASPSRAHKLLTEELQKVIRELSGRLDERAAGAAAALESDTTLV